MYICSYAYICVAVYHIAWLSAQVLPMLLILDPPAPAT